MKNGPSDMSLAHGSTVMREDRASHTSISRHGNSVFHHVLAPKKISNHHRCIPRPPATLTCRTTVAIRPRPVEDTTAITYPPLGEFHLRSFSRIDFDLHVRAHHVVFSPAQHRLASSFLTSMSLFLLLSSLHASSAVCVCFSVGCLCRCFNLNHAVHLTLNSPVE